MDIGTISSNLNSIRRQINNHAQCHGRDPSDIKLIAVSKNHPVEAISEGLDAGQLTFGENRVQELSGKVDKLPPSIDWHLIGHLQSNKVKPAVTYCSLIHSVDSIKLLRRINEIATQQEKIQNVLIQLNISGETSKHGFTCQEVTDHFQSIKEMKSIRCLGFMTMAPVSNSQEEIRTVFRDLRLFRDKIVIKHSLNLPELSMGMTSDFKIAIEEGSTMVRIGSAIFGPRTNIDSNT